MAHGSINAASNDLLLELMRLGDSQAFRAGAALITEGERTNALFVLVSGQLKVFASSSKGRAVIYYIVQPGEFFGESVLDGEPQPASVMATANSQCLLISEDRVRTLIEQSSAFRDCLIKGLISKMRSTSNMIRSLALTDVYGRTVALLNQLAVEEGDRRVLPRRVTQQEIADRVGATREMINHVLSQLTKGGFITRDDQRRMVLTSSLPSRW